VRLAALGLAPRQFQDFTPTPGTISTAMYVTGLDCEKREVLPVARKDSERRAQRQARGFQGDDREGPARKSRQAAGPGRGRPVAARGRSEKPEEQRQGKKGKNDAKADQGRGKLRRKAGHDG